MFRKMIRLVSFVLVLSLVGNVAADVNWIDAGPEHLWSTATNWDTGTVPTFADEVIIGMLPGPTIANEGAVADKVYVGYSETAGAMTMDGGTLTTTRNIVIAPGTLNMNSGTITTESNLNVGYNGSGTLNMNSGYITTGGYLNVGKKGSGTLNMNGGNIATVYFMIAWKPTATGHVNLHGGIITTVDFEMRVEAGSVGTMDVRAGTLTINGDKLSIVQGYIDNGWITAYGGNGTAQLDFDVTNKGKTTLTAIHFLNPNPADGSSISPGEVELSWTLPDPCVPGQPVPVDVYFTDDLEALQMFTDPAAIQVVSKQNVTSVVVQTQPKTRYYWAVDTYIGDPNDPIWGSTFSFFADNLTPEVDAGKDVVTWLEDGPRTGNLDATVTDDGAIMPYTLQWTLVSEPNDPNSADVMITDPGAEDTSITLSAVGEYVLQLEAFDGECTGSDTVTINVYNDSCEAARSMLARLRAVSWGPQW